MGVTRDIAKGTASDDNYAIYANQLYDEYKV